MTTNNLRKLADEYAPVLNAVLVFVNAVVRMVAPKRTTTTSAQRCPVPDVQFFRPTMYAVCDEPANRPTLPVCDVNRDGYPVPTDDEHRPDYSNVPVVSAPCVQANDEPTWDDVPTVRPNGKTPKRPARKEAAQTAASEQPARLPDAPTDRKAIQALAKQHGIRANMKSADIIAQLRQMGVVA